MLPEKAYGLKLFYFINRIANEATLDFFYKQLVYKQLYLIL